MSPLAPHADVEEPAPATLRSPPSTLRVRDHAVLVELTLVPFCPDAAPRDDEPPTRRYARVA